MVNNAVSAAMDSFWAALSLRSLAMVAADASEVPVLANILAGGEALSLPTVRRVWTLTTVASYFSAVTWSSKTLAYATKANSHSVVVRGASVRLLVDPQEEGSVVVFTRAALSYRLSLTSLFWKARQLAQIFVKYCTVGAHAWAAEPWLSHATSSISVKWALAYMFSTKIMTFLLSRKVKSMAMAALALQVSYRVHFVM